MSVTRYVTGLPASAWGRARDVQGNAQGNAQGGRARGARKGKSGGTFLASGRGGRGDRVCVCESSLGKNRKSNSL